MYQPNKDPLNKKFLCKQCGKTFRTRQGLSGHIQFKHGTKQEIKELDANYILSLALELEVIAKIMGWSESTIQARKAILVNWLDVKVCCNTLGIDLNKQDFKNYVIRKLASV